MLSLVAHLARGIHVGWVMAREGGLSFVDEAALPPTCASSCGSAASSSARASAPAACPRR